MVELTNKSRKRTMAEEEAEKQHSCPPGCRRSSRPKNRVVTSPYRRLRQLFWQTPQNNDKKETSSSMIRIGNLSLERVYSSPNIYVINNFMTAAELVYCDTLIESKIKFQKSFVDNDEHTHMEEQRTSTFVSLQKLQNAPVASLERRAAELLGLTVEQMEPLQLVRYRQDEFFGLHHDLGVLYEDKSVELPPRQVWCRRRMATLFVYLNDVQQGGCTHFPECNDLRVEPQRGRAVLFCNILENGTPDVRTVHEGEAVLGKGNVKYGMNIWACEE